MPETIEPMTFRLTQPFRAVEWSKVETLEDMKLILGACQISISPDNPNFDQVEKFLVEEL
jgi:hypothetical protein